MVLSTDIMRKVVRNNQNPTRLRQFMLWFKPSWRMDFEEYIDHYHRLNPKIRVQLRERSAKGSLSERFQFMARNYRSIYGPEDNIFDHRGLVEGLSKLGLPKKAHVVSYGAGSMHHECFLVKEFPQIEKITGIEPLEEMRQLTPKTAFNILGLKKRSKVKNIRGTFRESPSIIPASVDAVISNEAFHHVKNPELALHNMVSKLKPGGGIVLIYRPTYKTKPSSPGELGSILKRLGVRVISSRSIKRDKVELDNNIHLIVGKKEL